MPRGTGGWRWPVLNVEPQESDVSAARYDPAGTPFPGFEQSDAIHVDDVTRCRVWRCTRSWGMLCLAFDRGEVYWTLGFTLP
jgi:hypothetical protein